MSLFKDGQAARCILSIVAVSLLVIPTPASTVPQCQVIPDTGVVYSLVATEVIVKCIVKPGLSEACM